MKNLRQKTEVGMNPGIEMSLIRADADRES